MIHRSIQTWFRAQGWTPFDFQQAAWRAYMAGRSGLVNTPTGTGKSYAAWMGPLAEWLVEHGPLKGTRRAAPPPLRVLWITPLRALANDTVETLQAPLKALKIPWTVELRTGDTSSATRRRQRERLPSALVTTPESLSLLLSYEDTREKMAELRCVVVDEWHELMGSKRGVQTELGLARLRQWRPGLRTWGLSATIGNLEQAMQVLMGTEEASRQAELIRGPEEKRTEIITVTPPDVGRFPWAGHLGITLLHEVLQAIERADSTLLFTNTRSQAELWFRNIVTHRPEWIGQVALHHGSIDRDLRERVEGLLRAGKLRCVVCTSSLDLGVDFTPVDQVIQVGSPKGVARLLQRAGRSGHQPGGVSRILCVPTHAFELVEFSAVREAAARRQMESRPPLDRPLDVLVQHVVTLGAGGGFKPDEVYEEVRCTYAFRNLSAQEWQWTLDFVTRGGPALRAYPQYARLVEQDGRLIVASSKLARMHRLAIGTITSDASLHVKYLKGRSLGTIEESFISRLNPGDRFMFAGRVLELIRVREMAAWVKPATQRSGAVPRWYGGRLPLSTELAEAVRAKLEQARAGEYLSTEMEAVRPLLELQGAWSVIPGRDELLIERITSGGGHHLFLYPFEGRLVHEGLGILLAYRLARQAPRSITVSMNDYGVELLSPEPIVLDEQGWREALRCDGLVEDLLASLNASELARRRFRDIARIAGLLFPGYPGAQKSTRQLQASSSLFYEVFSEYDPENLLLDQARREVLNEQLEVARLRRTLERIAERRLVMVESPRLTPMSFPLWADQLAEQISSERWSKRVQRMVLQLEKAASRMSSKKTRSRRASDRVVG